MAINTFHRRLKRWYAAHGRKDLPWRNTSDVYEIYISEVMLQQTQVKTVLERFYFQFLKRFPTLESLAKAPEKEVLKAWQGLGYYNRALNLHKAAKQIAGNRLQVTDGLTHLHPATCHLSPHFPRNIDKLMQLSGIGRNTAHAIAAFAYHQPVAVMEANVKRVLCRIFALKKPTDAELWEKAGQLLDTQNPFDYNQAMMDIGALVCTKRSPRCGECPASEICKGKESPELYPTPKNKKSVPVRHKHIVVFQNTRGEFFATARGTRFLQGLYHFVEMSEPPAFAAMTHIGTIEQQYSHFTLKAEVHLVPGTKEQGKDWHSPEKLAKLPVSMAEKKILKLITK